MGDVYVFLLVLILPALSIAVIPTAQTASWIILGEVLCFVAGYLLCYAKTSDRGKG